jgi:NAD(P)-dependent dehydrogenase (short-subunit alcohol dehydrogenase family)
LVHLAPLGGASGLAGKSLAAWHAAVRADVRQLYLLIRAAAPDLCAVGRAKGAAILAATALGGDFGEARCPDVPTHGGVIGFLRTAAIELPDVRCRIVDGDGTADPGVVADRVCTELDSDGPLEIGYIGTRRLTIAPRPTPLDGARAPARAPLIGPGSVVLLTGGARGITAALATELARRFQPTLVLAGRSPAPPEHEDPRTAPLEGSALKTLLAADLARTREGVRPVDVEAAYLRVIHAREIGRTLAACAAAGAQAEYRQADVRDERSLGTLLEEIYRRHRRLDLVVHGAGVIEDKLIADKSPESFDRVVHTKADSAFLLARLLRPEGLRALVLMSSVTAAFGNRGQADYGAANGIYNVFAQCLATQWPGRVVALNWGPWAGSGMASEAVREQFVAREITPIDPAAGVAAFLSELESDRRDPVVVLGSGPWSDERRWAEQGVAVTA